MTKRRVIKKNKIRKQHKPSALSSWWSGLGFEERNRITGGFWKTSCWILCLLLVCAVFYMLQGYALRDDRSEPKPIRVSFSNECSWAPAQLKRIIADELISEKSDYRDKRLTADIYRKALGSPWISSVASVRKFRDRQGNGVVELDCELRRPMAVVKYGDECCYVDGEGVRLRDSEADPQVPRWQTVVYDSVLRDNVSRQFIEISHVPSASKAWRIPYVVIELNPQFDSPMPRAGAKWQSPALGDGLKLAKLLYQRKYSSQITRIDVRNYGGRVSRNLEHIGFWAGRTYVKFGRFPHPDGVDWVVEPQRKIANLDRYVALNDGQLAGTAGVDLQVDTIDDAYYGANIEKP